MPWWKSFQLGYGGAGRVGLRDDLKRNYRQMRNDSKPFERLRQGSIAPEVKGPDELDQLPERKSFEYCRIVIHPHRRCHGCFRL